ncbi:MAG: glycosyltransferase family 2 protein [Chloroflexota bacterium]
MERKTCSVVIPVYRSAETLGLLVDRLSKVLPLVAEQYEVILVNDGSPDNSWEVIQDLARQHSWLVGICLMRNYGQHNALLCGIKAAKHEVIVTMDDDLQHPPEEIPKLIAALGDKYDVVYGKPIKQQHGLWRDLASQITKLTLQNAMGAKTAQNTSAFRAFRTQIRNAFTDYQSPFVAIDVLLTWGTTRFTFVDVLHDQRTVGTSNYTFRKLVFHALNMLTGFSILPLQFASLTGLGFALFGMVILVRVVGRYLIVGSGLPGFTFLASTIAIFSGIQLFALGVIGEYLARMYFRSMGRPSSVIRDRVGFDSDL